MGKLYFGEPIYVVFDVSESSEDNAILNIHGDMGINDNEDPDPPPTPPDRDAAAEGGQNQPQPRGRRGLLPGTWFADVVCCFGGRRGLLPVV